MFPYLIVIVPMALYGFYHFVIKDPDSSESVEYQEYGHVKSDKQVETVLLYPYDPYSFDTVYQLHGNADQTGDQTAGAVV